MKWIIIPSIMMGSVVGTLASKSMKMIDCEQFSGDVCAGESTVWRKWYSCFSGYTCGGGGIYFGCARFAGNVIDP